MQNTIRAVRKAVFPVAGLGTRLVPATKVLPKEMLTIVDRPLIQMAVEEAREAGIEEFIFVIGRGKEMLIQHFGDAPELVKILESRGKTDQVAKVNEAKIPEGALRAVEQEEALGLGHAVWCARELVGDEPFAVILPDDAVLHTKGCLAQMMDAYNMQGGNIVAACEVKLQDTSKYGILDVAARNGDVVSVCGLVEKPSPDRAPSNMAIMGRYILQPEIFSYLARHERGAGGEIQLTDAMALLLRDQKFSGLLFKGERLDCGNEIGFVKAQVAFALDKPHLAPELAEYLAEKLRQYYEECGEESRNSRLKAVNS